MNFVLGSLHEAAIGVGVGHDPASLKTFLEPDCAAAIWQRQLPPGVEAWINCLDPARMPRGRVVLPPYAVGKTVEHLCNMSELPAGSERDWLQRDITSLAGVFSSLLDAKFLRLRLDVVTTNSCRKFHIDAIRARLICTYRGTGTQYGNSVDGGDPDQVYTVPTGSPVMLRGTRWRENPSSDLLHRSPPIEGSGEVRLLLVLDEMQSPGDESDHSQETLH
ncbi:MAG: DUF1826 domain-containing protein [Pseudomonadota bacterium]